MTVHSTSNGTAVCHIPIFCDKVIAVSIWTVFRTSIEIAYLFRPSSPPHFSLDSRNLRWNRKEKRKFIKAFDSLYLIVDMNLIAHSKHNSLVIRKRSWALAVFLSFLVLFISFQNNPSEINFDFVQFEIVFPQIVHVFGAKTTHIATELRQFSAFVTLMPCPRVFTQIRPIARLTVESRLIVFDWFAAICNEMRNEKRVKLVNVLCWENVDSPLQKCQQSQTNFIQKNIYFSFKFVGFPL